MGFGQIRYAEAAGSAQVLIQAGERTPIAFVIDPIQTQDFLNSPFAGHVFFDGTTILPRLYGDLIDVLVNLLVTAMVAGGRLKFDIDVGSPLGPTGADTADLFDAAGVAERVTGRLTIQTLQYFMTNGARLYLTPTVPVTLVNEAVLIQPRSTVGG